MTPRRRTVRIALVDTVAIIILGAVAATLLLGMAALTGVIR